MSELVRVSVSLDKKLVEKFDRQISTDGYPTRSKAVADLIINSLVKHEWEQNKETAGAIIMVYDHHKRGLTNRLVSIQHDFHTLIISSQHVHLDHHNCMEIVAVKGQPEKVNTLAAKLKTTKGVKYACLATASTGKAF